MSVTIWFITKETSLSGMWAYILFILYTKYRISLPREYETFPINQQQNQAITVIKDWIMGEDYTLDRVCKKCYLKYNRMRHVWFMFVY